MTRAFTTRRLRWALPAGVAAAIAVASLTTAGASGADAEPNLPTRTAAQILASLEQANPAGFSGTIVENAKLGLPQLPDIQGGGDASLSLTNLVTGAHTLRVWYAGQQKQRVALLGQLSESDVIHNGSDLWTYSSTSRQVTHSTVKSSDSAALTHRDIGGMTPQAVADAALKAIDPTTAVQVDRTARVAGRAAYQLLLTPRDARSLIGSVRLAVDAQTSVPLRVQVFARGASSPAIQVGFTDVSFTVPDASVFAFVPPAGSTVSPGNASGPGGPKVDRGAMKVAPGIKGPGGQAPSKTGSSAHPAISVLGTGWTAVVEVKNPPGGLGSTNGPSSMDILNHIATPVSGGKLITSALVSVFIADDGTVYAGPVSAAAIEQVAATGHGL